MDNTDSIDSAVNCIDEATVNQHRSHRVKLQRKLIPSEGQ